MAKNLHFHIADDVHALGIRGVLLQMRGLVNKERDEAFEKFRTNLAQRLRPVYTPKDIKADPTLQGCRALHTKIGRSNRSFPSASGKPVGSARHNSFDLTCSSTSTTASHWRRVSRSAHTTLTRLRAT